MARRKIKAGRSLFRHPEKIKKPDTTGLRARFRPLFEFLNGMDERRLMDYSASCCFFLFMSLVPILMILCCLLPYTPFSRELVLSAVDRYFTQSLGNVVRRIVTAIYASNRATLTLSIVLTLYSVSVAMRAIMRGLNAAYNVDPKTLPNFFVFTLQALLLFMFMLAAMIVSLFVMVYGEKIIELITGLIPSFDRIGDVLAGVRFLVTMVLLAGFFLVLYRIIPACRLRWRDQLPGAVFSAAAWVLFSWIYSLYLRISDQYGAYGFLGTSMVAMMWMFYILYFFLLGGYINSALTARRLAKAEAAAGDGQEQEQNK